MRRCPKCNDVFENERVYCTNDGTPLVSEDFALPSEANEDESEERTVIRAKPLEINFDQPAPAPAPPVQSQPNPAPPSVATSKKKGGCFKGFLLITIGVVLGAVIVGGIGVGGFLYFQMEKQRVAEEERQRATEEKKAPQETIKTGHQKPGTLEESKLNGKVIARSAVLRKSARSTAARVDVLPRNDRIRIVRRRTSTSAWYLIECEHESEGWIHGNSIAYTK